MVEQFKTTDDSLTALSAQVGTWTLQLTSSNVPLGTDSKPTELSVYSDQRTIRLLHNFATGGDGSGEGQGADGYIKLLGAGNNQSSLTMQKTFAAFASAAGGQIKTIVTSFDHIRLGLLTAKTTFANAEDDTLTAAQMFEILGGSTPPTTTPPGTTPPNTTTTTSTP
jgi:hypothetical protein